MSLQWGTGGAHRWEIQLRNPGLQPRALLGADATGGLASQCSIPVEFPRPTKHPDQFAAARHLARTRPSRPRATLPPV